MLVAFHDDRLDRVTDRSGAIADLTWDEVRAARVAGTEHIPLFEDLLSTWPDLRINVDAKADTSVEPLIELIKRTGTRDRLLVAAFSDRRIDRLRDALGQQLCTGMGPRQIAKLTAASKRAPIYGGFRGDAAQVPMNAGPVRIVNRRFVEAAHDHGVAVHVWTIDDPAEMHNLLDLDVDGIMTDRPAILRDVLIERGQWHGTDTDTETE